MIICGRRSGWTHVGPIFQKNFCRLSKRDLAYFESINSYIKRK